MILRARADITDKDGNRLGLKNDIYIHHILVANLARKLAIAPIIPTRTSCPNRQKPGNGMQGVGGLGGMMSTPKGGAEHSHSKREPQIGGAGGRGSVPGLNFDLFIVKGNEGDTQNFSPYNTADVKSGYWIGHDDRLSALVSLFCDIDFVIRLTE
jgi:hypothetical protein